MQKDENHQERITEIIEQMEEASNRCEKNFCCHKSDFKDICSANDFGLSDFVKCLEKNAQDCNFSLSFGYGYLCKCPLRVYIAKNLEK